MKIEKELFVSKSKLIQKMLFSFALGRYSTLWRKKIIKKVGDLLDSKEILKQFEHVAKYYIEELSKYSLDEFTRKPSESEWSLGQMYNHLIKGTLYLHLKAIEQCANANANASDGGNKTEIGELIFKEGTFPPIRVKGPDTPDFTPLNPTGKKEVKEGLLQIIEKMREIERKLSDIPASQKVQHRAMGHLNAEEYFQLIEMHFRHHLRQKERIDQFLLK
ncbi:DinB family protein [Metabacillus halosaccharovorans]|uniref:DinB family protein n=1 Tax=Metabacillus halosaccharovorans TaxID=930124 RepID=UPI0031839066